ncbi:MAG TPA: NifB/NifX family molybdenum-iron cluster-binding protein [Syntrophales bacterium]|nr:NifB/NifX family molybdenum-iron cluster-binding protein [Syntrophales bacterium]
MKLAFSSMGKDLQAEVDPRFGRAAYFIIVDKDTLDFEAIPNPHTQAGGAAGIQAARLVVDQGVTAVVTGNCGPNAFQVLQAAGVQVITGVRGSIEDALSSVKAGLFEKAEKPNVGDHFGMAPAAGGLGKGSGAGRGRGMGRGGGQGQGGGRGGGRGQGGVFRKGKN